MKKLLLVVFLMSTIITAQEKFKISSQIRPRYEVDNKDFNSSTNASSAIFLRTRLGLTFMPTKGVTGFIQAQDSRTFGEEASTTTNIKNLDLHQGYFKIEDLFELPVDLKAGRFDMSYGSERFIGAVNWNNIGRSFDGAIFTLKTSAFKFDLFAVREFERNNRGDSLDQNVYGLFADILNVPSYKIQPFVIHQQVTKTDQLKRTTVGFNIKGDFGNFIHEIDLGYQLGTVIASNRKQDVSAYTFSFGANYKFDVPAKPTIGLQVDIVSGDSNPADNDYKSYTSLYATGHKLFGYMDYFTNFPNDTYGLGVMDLIGKFGINATDKFNLALHVHVFNSMEEYTKIKGGTSKSFGSEVDLVGSYKYNEAVTFEGGVSFFSAGDIFKEKRGSDSSTWGYLMAVVNF